MASEDREKVVEAFAGSEALFGWEVSKDGEEHVHVLTVNGGDSEHERLKKRIKSLSLVGKPGWWSKKNYKSYVFGISYTVKQGDWRIIGTWFTKELIDASVDAWSRKTKVIEEEVKLKDTDKDWQLTFTNVVRVCLNYAKEHDLQTDDLGVVLRKLTHKTRWIPSPAMLKNGLDPFYFELFKHKKNQGTEAETPVWWDRRPEVTYKRIRLE